jgi:hypothetical protein
MSHYQNVLEDLRQRYPVEVLPYVPPYKETASMDEKFDALYETIDRAKRLGDRKLQLSNAYFIGQFLMKEVSLNSLRSHYSRRLSIHYRTVASRTYLIFECFGAAQIMRTSYTTLTTIRELRQEEYTDLVARSWRIFNGVEN